jgi:hypothetical protein
MIEGIKIYDCKFWKKSCREDAGVGGTPKTWIGREKSGSSGYLRTGV